MITNLKYLHTIIVCMVCNIAFAVAPVNDDCSGAITIPVNASYLATTGDVSGASQSIAACYAGGNPDDDVWFKFVATGRNISIKVVGNYYFDPVVELLSDCSTSISCTNYSTGTDEIVNATLLTSGATYYLRVYDYGSNIPTDPTFSIGAYLRPDNDECDYQHETILTHEVDYTPISGDVTNATSSGLNCGTGTYSTSDVWYKFFPAGPNATIKVVPSASYDPVVQLLSSCNVSSYYFCTNDAGPGGTETITMTLPYIQYYYIRVFQNGNTNPATKTFDIGVYGATATGLLSNPANTKRISIYPNPTQSEIHVNLEDFNDVVLMEIYDSKGNLVQHQIVTASSDTHISINPLVNGIYSIKFISDKITITDKIVILY